jgi:hypothetical protein
LFGGRSRIFGAVLGGIIVAVIYNGVILIGLGATGQYIWTAIVLLAGRGPGRPGPTRQQPCLTGLQLSPATWPEYRSWHTGLRS